MNQGVWRGDEMYETTWMDHEGNLWSGHLGWDRSKDRMIQRKSVGVDYILALEREANPPKKDNRLHDYARRGYGKHQGWKR